MSGQTQRKQREQRLKQQRREIRNISKSLAKEEAYNLKMADEQRVRDTLAEMMNHPDRFITYDTGTPGKVKMNISVPAQVAEFDIVCRREDAVVQDLNVESKQFPFPKTKTVYCDGIDPDKPLALFSEDVHVYRNV